MSEQSEHEALGRIIRRTVESAPRKQISPFFASRAVNAVRSLDEEIRRRARLRRGSSLLAFYWIALLSITVLSTSSLATSPFGQATALILVPVGFALGLYWRRVLKGLLGLASIFLG